LKNISEERTRKERIDPQLERAGWYLRDHSKVRIEIPVDGYDAAPWNGVTDYCLYRENGEALAVVEAKKNGGGCSAGGSATHALCDGDRETPEFPPLWFF